MTRKDYELIAAAFSEAIGKIIDVEPPEHKPYLMDGLKYGIDYVSAALHRDNPRFDRQKFSRAAGYFS